MKEKLSVVLVVRNEEAMIRECLESVRFADEIVVVDQSSPDRTVEIAREFTDNVIITEPKRYCEPDRQTGMDASSGNWILVMDADERVPPELADEISEILENNTRGLNAYKVTRRNHFLGKWIKTCGWYPGETLRLFRKESVRFSDRIHDGINAPDETGVLKVDLVHYSYRDLEQYFEKMNRYTGVLADEYFVNGTRISWKNSGWFFGLKPLYIFLIKYFRKQGFRDGFYGFFISFSAALTIFVSYAKLWELQQLKNRG